jgi:Asp-tRNA(Asn)/Glu-tRNA(Gln) amidotransferase B subunit
MIKHGTEPQTVIEEKGLKPVGEADVLAWIEEVFAEKPELKEDIVA